MSALLCSDANLLFAIKEGWTVAVDATFSDGNSRRIVARCQLAPPKESAQEPATSTTKSAAMPTSERYLGQRFLLPEGKTSSLEEAQNLLIILGYDAGAADGTMGEKTKAALQKFAASEGLAFDGNVSDDLLARLRKRATAGAD
jgi:peptidoglycan hydrolase-like protein with peptidoglycan-binding domain